MVRVFSNLSSMKSQSAADEITLNKKINIILTVFSAKGAKIRSSAGNGPAEIHYCESVKTTRSMVCEDEK